MKRDALNAIAIAYDRCEASERADTPHHSLAVKQSPRLPVMPAFPETDEHSNGGTKPKWNQELVFALRDEYDQVP